jgi:hypothetical protein
VNLDVKLRLPAGSEESGNPPLTGAFNEMVFVGELPRRCERETDLAEPTELASLEFNISDSHYPILHFWLTPDFLQASANRVCNCSFVKIDTPPRNMPFHATLHPSAFRSLTNSCTISGNPSIMCVPWTLFGQSHSSSL